MKRLGLLAGLLGLIALGWLIVHQGVGQIAATVARAGWPLLWLLPVHGVAIALDARAWQGLLRAAAPAAHPGMLFLWWVASVREAVNRLLPTANVGGELAGIRLGRLQVGDTSAVTASVVVEVMVTLFSQYLFCVVGVLLLIAAIPGGHQEQRALTIGGGLLLSLPLPVAFALALRHGALFARLERLARRLLGEEHRMVDAIAGADLGAGLDQRIRSLLGRLRTPVTAAFWQLLGLTAGTVETWFALRLLGHPVSFGEALAIESLTMAARNMAFFVPGGLGVQEAVVMLLGQLLGIDAQTALSLALVRRAREVLYGVPALLSWQWFEVRRWRDRHGGPAAAGAMRRRER